MSVLETPPPQPGDDLDGLLRAFLRSQMPYPWPSPRLLAATSSPRRPANGRSLMRSRWALAASITLLLCGSWLLPSRFPSDAKMEPGTNGAIIGSDDVRHPFHKDNKAKKKRNKNNPGLAVDIDDQLPELDGSDLPKLR